MKLLHPFHQLTWKQTFLLSFTFLLIAAGVVANTAMYTPTRTVSKASLIKPTPALPGTEWYPASPPSITKLEPWFGKPGDTVRLRGQNFGKAQWQSQITLNQLKLTVIAWSDQAIDFKLPQTGSGDLNLQIGSFAPVLIPVSVTKSLADPQLYFNDGQLWLKNLNTVATLVLNQKDHYQLQPASTQAITSYAPAALSHASLQDSAGQLLPLSLPPESLLH